MAVFDMQTCRNNHQKLKCPASIGRVHNRTEFVYSLCLKWSQLAYTLQVVNDAAVELQQSQWHSDQCNARIFHWMTFQIVNLHNNGCYRRVTSTRLKLCSCLEEQEQDLCYVVITLPVWYKNSSGAEIANVNFYAVRPEATRIRWNNAK